MKIAISGCLNSGNMDTFRRSSIINSLLTHKIGTTRLFSDWQCLHVDIVEKDFTFVARNEWKGECPRNVIKQQFPKVSPLQSLLKTYSV